MKNKGTTFPELMIVLLIISLGLFVFLKMTTDYTKSVVMARELFVLNSALQEKYQILIGIRNKMLEKDFTEEGPQQVTDWFKTGYYCIEYGEEPKQVSDSVNCDYKFINDQSPGITYQVQIIANTSTADIIITGEIKKFGLKSELRGSLTKWHPLFQ